MAGASRPEHGASARVPTPPDQPAVGMGGPDRVIGSSTRSRAVVLGVVIGLGLIGLVLASPAAPEVRRAVSGVGLVASAIALAVSCRFRSRHSEGRRARAWVLFGAGALTAALGNVWLTAVDLLDAPARRAGDALILLSLVLVIAGLAAYPFGRRRPPDVLRLLLDGIVLAGSILLVLGNTVLPGTVDQPSVRSIALLLAPLIDIVMTTVTWLLLVQAPRRDRPGLALAATGFALFTVSEVLAATARGGSGFAFGTLVDLGWIAGYAVLAIAIRWAPPSYPTAPEDEPDQPSIASSLLLFAMFLAAATSTVVVLWQGDGTVADVVLLGAVLVAIIGRQVLLLVDNDRLRQGLEQRVLERTNELAEITQRTDLMVDSVEDGVYGVDSAGRVSFVNPAGARLLGLPRDNLLGRPAHEAFHSHPTTRCYLRTIQRSGLPITGLDDFYRAADGREVPVEVSASPLVEGTGVRGVVVVFRDVTRRREVDRMKNEFVSMVSHELKTPLTAIRGSLGLLAGGALGELAPPATRMVEIAMDSSERLTRMINEILDMERIESGALPMQLTTLEAADLVAAAQDQVQVIAGEAAVAVRLERADGRVVADPDRVVQTLINLIGNAIKYSPSPGEVSIAAVVAPDGQLVTFSVRDRGRGIPANRLEAIFERFEQVDSSDAREKGGTGLGLAISRSIVERLGGRIWAENNADGGATFSFTLPAARDGAGPSERRGPGPDDPRPDGDRPMVS